MTPLKKAIRGLLTGPVPLTVKEIHEALLKDPDFHQVTFGQVAKAVSDLKDMGEIDLIPHYSASH